MISIVQLINIYIYGGNSALGFMFFICGVFLLGYFIILLIERLSKKSFVEKVRFVSKHKNIIYVCKEDGKVKRIRIVDPTLIEHVVPQQEMEVTLSSIVQIPMHLVIKEIGTESADGYEAQSIFSHKKTFKHAAWANALIINRLEACEEQIDKPLSILSHILAAEQIWLARINGEGTAQYEIWPVFTLEQCRQQMEQNNKGYELLFIQLNVTDLARKAVYQNSKGTDFATAIGEVLTHVSLHGSYHRGQINTLLRQVGAVPVNTDYIAFVRSLDDK